MTHIKNTDTAALLTDNNRPLIVFGEDWGAHPSSTQHIVSVLGQNRKVIWINSIGLRKPKLTWNDLGRLCNKIKSFIVNQSYPQKEVNKGVKKAVNKQGKKSVNKEINNNFIIINPLVIPCANSWLSLTLSKVILKCQLKFSCKEVDIANPIIWTSLPTSVDYLTLFDKAPCVYYCGDDFSSLAGVDHAFVSQKEKELVEKANYIFTASEKMLDRFPSDKGINIPHGVNFSLFSQQVKIPPSDLPKGKPIAGFYGSISTWLDQTLLAETIKALPHWSFVFIGKVECNIDKLLSFSNVKFLGTRSHNELPNYIQNWNVAMLPFVNNKQIQMCNPLKLREYLASGTPVVTTDFNALKGYRQYIQVSTEEKPFHEAVLLANAEITPMVNFDTLEELSDLLAITQVKNTRKSSVMNESWESRAQDVQHYLAMC